MRFHFNACLLILTLPLFACGGSGSGGVEVGPDYPSLFDTTSEETSALQVHSLNTASLAVAAGSGSLDRANDRVSGGGLAGDVNATRTLIELDVGGTVEIIDGSTDYVAVFLAQPLSVDASFGVVGIPTAIADLPVTATYSGMTNFSIVDNDSFYELVGAASVTADFGAGDLDVIFSSLDGTRTDGVSAPQNVTNVATVSINDAVISGNTFSGGDADLSSTQITTDLTGAEVVETSGGFYGPNADEVGGVVLIDDTGTGELLMLGDFVAD